MKKDIFNMMRFLIVAFCLFVAGIQRVDAAQQYQGLCSYVKMEILQELSIERIGFLATLEVTNNEGDASITDFSAALTFNQQVLVPGEEGAEASDYFFVQPPKLVGISAIDGTGIIRPGETATISWFIIPKVSAGGTDPIGLQYSVGAFLGGSIYGLQIAPEVLAVIPDTITVKPEPQLEITYFQPRDVDGDNPFTPDVVEPPIPFTLGVLVKNSGYGRATRVNIESEQPRIVEDLQGLQVIPMLLGSRVNDLPTNYSSLTLTFGDIEPGRCGKGAWDMITTLSGEFTEFSASYTHASELGGRDTSVITSLNAYFMVHEVLNDQPDRDGLLDFLADTTDGSEMIPNLLYESDCVTTPVNQLTGVEVLEYSNGIATLSATVDFENWVYMRLDDPAQAKYPIESVVRSDGKVLDPHNYWTNIRYRDPDNEKLTYLNIFDFVALGQYQYEVTYAQPGTDMAPPVTTLLFSGPMEAKDGTYFILPETQILFIAEDDSPVAMYYKLDDDVDFSPALPFTIADAGEHTLTYYSEDFLGNVETWNVATIVVSTDDPQFDTMISDTDELFITGDSLSVRPTSVSLVFNGVMSAASLNGEADVFQGVFAYPSLSGIPSSPTVSDTATIIVSGNNVDYYRYHLGSDSWSSEFPVSQPIQLIGLNGAVQLTVSARSQYGDYTVDEDALTLSWVVDTGAQDMSITGIAETPTRTTEATLTVTGTDNFCYRIDGNAYLPDDGFGSPVVLPLLTDGNHSVEFLPRADVGTVCPADGIGTMVSWTVDRQYGFSFPVEERIRHQSLGQIDGNLTEYVWDGRNDASIVVPPGWYTIRITVTDGLGRSTSAARLVQVGDLVADGTLLSDAGNAGQEEAHAFGKWVVWQDQRNGDWDIYAMDLTADPATTVPVRVAPLNQEKPNTDGDYVVWEERQGDGSWDIWAWKLGSTDSVFAVTSTPDANESNPAVYWPWVVYQTKSVVDPTAPWQIQAYNALTDTTEIIDATTQDQLDPRVHKQRIVWQDFRDVGFGEIYFKDLKTSEIKRITDDPAGQYHPVISDQWIVWADNRTIQFDLYGYNLLRNTEVQLTDTPEDETRPLINDKWVVCSEDSAAETHTNVRIVSLSNLAAIQMTNTKSEKQKPAMASGKLVWTDMVDSQKKIMFGTIPDLQPVFNNQNMVVVTDGMADGLPDAFALLELWQQEAGVTAITQYTSLVPAVISEIVSWNGSGPVGDDFTLEAGSYLWVRFDQAHILDLGRGSCGTIDFEAGVNVLTYSCFPDHYSAYKLIREIGITNMSGLRVLDADSGRWRTVSIINDKIVGENFVVPRISVLMIDMKSPLVGWKPGE